jgi:hypothetical protein
MTYCVQWCIHLKKSGKKGDKRLSFVMNVERFGELNDGTTLIVIWKLVANANQLIVSVQIPASVIPEFR